MKDHQNIAWALRWMAEGETVHVGETNRELLQQAADTIEQLADQLERAQLPLPEVEEVA